MALTDSLVSYWKMDESSTGAGAVTRVDSHGPNDLTDNNTTASGTGIINNGADFELANAETLSITDASQTGLDFTSDLSFSFWLNFESLPVAGTDRALIAKRTVASNRSYSVYSTFISAGNYGIGFSTSDDGAGEVFNSVNVGNLSTATWYHFVGIYDASAGSWQVYQDDVSQGTATGYDTSIFNGTSPFIVGDYNGGSHYDGIFDEFGAWSRTLTSDEVTELYNGGAGLSYDDFSSGGGASPQIPTLLMLGVG